LSSSDERLKADAGVLALSFRVLQSLGRRLPGCVLQPVGGHLLRFYGWNVLHI
jgi:hypothetical protein